MIKPDFKTLHSCEWIQITHPKDQFNSNKNSFKVCSVICDILWPSKKPMNSSPRYIAQLLIRQLEIEHKLVLFSAFEPEFRAFKPNTISNCLLNPKKMDRHFEIPQPYTTGSDMFRTNILVEYEKYFANIDYYMSLAGIDIQDFSNEYGDGQLECPLMPSWGLEAADQYFILKQALKEIGKQHNMEISFMTKPIMEGSSNGCHFNHSLWNIGRNRNAFYHKDSKSFF